MKSKKDTCAVFRADSSRSFQGYGEQSPLEKTVLKHGPFQQNLGSSKQE